MSLWLLQTKYLIINYLALHCLFTFLQLPIWASELTKPSIFSDDVEL